MNSATFSLQQKSSYRLRLSDRSRLRVERGAVNESFTEEVERCSQLWIFSQVAVSRFN